jgi:hypothetical protein
LRKRGDIVTAVRAQVAPRAPGEYRLDIRTTLRKQMRDDVREQHVAEVVAIECAEDDDARLRQRASVCQMASFRAAGKTRRRALTIV